MNVDKEYGHDEYEYENGHDEDYRRTDITVSPRTILSNKFDADKLIDANMDIEIAEMCLFLTRSSFIEWLESANLYPFMYMAKSNYYMLKEVYEFAMNETYLNSESMVL